MANIRILYDSLSDDATLTATPTSGSLAAGNLKTNAKEEVWRAVGKEATITATWPNSVTVDALAIGWSNLTQDALIKVRFFSDSLDVTPASTLVVDPDDQYGAAERAQAQAWFASIAVEKVEIWISDKTNANDIEIGRLAIGVRHEMTYNPKYGAQLSVVDQSKLNRTESGAARFESGATYRTLTIDFDVLEQTDAALLSRLVTRDKSQTMFVSLFPDSAGWKRAAHSFFAVLSAGGAKFGYPMLNMWSTGIVLEEMW